MGDIADWHVEQMLENSLDGVTKQHVSGKVQKCDRCMGKGYIRIGLGDSRQCSSCNGTGKLNRVVTTTNLRYERVDLDDRQRIADWNAGVLENVVSNQPKIKELVRMEKGQFIAVVKYVNGYNGKDYDFLSDIPLQHGDMVVIEDRNGFNLGEVVGVKRSSVNANKWIVDKVDTSTHVARREQEIKRKELEHAMEERMKKVNKLDRYRELAKSDPEMKRMLEEYQATTGMNLIEGN